MGKKRNFSSRDAHDNPINEYDPKEAKIGPITSYEDVADSEDEFHISRDKVSLDDWPDAKRRKRLQDDDTHLELSDEEVLAYSENDSEQDLKIPETSKDRNARRGPGLESEEEEEEEEDAEGWGGAKQDYYNNHQIETEADALEEEAEAKRLQLKKLKKMSAADFGFNEEEWLAEENDEEDKGVVTEVIKEIEITKEMQPEERLGILQMRYLEFEPLANELLLLQPTFRELQKQAETEPSINGFQSFTVVKCRALAAYISTLSMYFAIIASPANGYTGEAKALNPSELRDHSIMDYLLKCRELWFKAQSLNTYAPEPLPGHNPDISAADLLDEIHADPQPDTSFKQTKSKTKIKSSVAGTTATSIRAERLKMADKELQDFMKILPKPEIGVKRSKIKSIIPNDESDGSDFGEEDSMDARSALEKAQKKKSLRFYTSQIAQKANKRMGAGRDAGGDEDVPHRERLRDRQARLNAEAEKRGKRGKKLGEEDRQCDSSEDNIAEQVRKEGNEYYDMIAKTAQQKKADKAARLQASSEGDLERIVDDTLGGNEKRAIGYVIEKNKGLAPKRKKDVRNPRVKKRKKFEEKKKKLVSIRAVYKGGEERGGYGGEKTGIKSGLIKSIKL